VTKAGHRDRFVRKFAIHRIMMIRRQQLTREQAVQKARHYCGYQERSHHETKEKLYSFGLWKKDVEEILSGLIEENYLNEERFAIQFAGGHFRLKQWGRVKIRFELKQRQVSDYCLKKALASIDGGDYAKTLEKLAWKKWELLKEEGNHLIRRHKLKQYLLQKGYEPELISQTITAID
jgi:regulatory protein